MATHMFWSDKLVGRLTIARGPATETIMIYLNTSPPAIQLLNTATNLGNSTELGESLAVTQAYTGVKLPGNAVINTALGSIGLGAVGGLDRPIPSFLCKQIDDPNFERFEMTSDLDSKGVPLLKYRHVVQTMKVVAYSMIEKNLFGEVYVSLRTENRRIVQGHLRAAGNTATE